MQLFYEKIDNWTLYRFHNIHIKYKQMSILTHEELIGCNRSGIYDVGIPIIGYKKVRYRTLSSLTIIPYYIQNYAIVELEIPIGAKIVRPFSRYDSYEQIHNPSHKLRTDKAIVTNIYWSDLTEISDPCEFYSYFDERFKYVKGREHVPNYFNDDVTQELCSGIHFFQTLGEAQDYMF
jgi:hypothetical protein